MSRQRTNCLSTSPAGEESLCGMDLFDVNLSGILELERIDEDDLFEDDDEAWETFIAVLSGTERAEPTEREAAIEMAVSLLNNWREPMAAIARGINYGNLKEATCPI